MRLGSGGCVLGLEAWKLLWLAVVACSWLPFSVLAQDEARFEAALATLRIFCSEPECIVELDGVERGLTRRGFYLVLEVPAGRARAVISRMGFHPYEEDLLLIPGRTQEIVALLTPEGEAKPVGRSIPPPTRKPLPVATPASVPPAEPLGAPDQGAHGEDAALGEEEVELPSLRAVIRPKTMPDAKAICRQNRQFLAKAEEYAGQKQFEVAVQLAGRVDRTRDCHFEFIEAQGLLAEIKLLQRKDYQGAIEAAEKGLAVDPRQTILWFMKGYSSYQLDRYEEAQAALRQVLKLYRIVPIEQRTLMEARYFLADSADRLAAQQLKTHPERRRQVENAALAAWREFQDYCGETGCPDKLVRRAEEQIAGLEQRMASAR